VSGEPWIRAAAETVASLGFTLLNSDQPAATGGPRLVVALRAAPTLRHFDPEVVTCWVAAAGRGRPLSIDRKFESGERVIAWGHVHVIDRLGIENRFLTFGGQVRVGDVDADLRIVEHASPGPIVRWGGHSQGSDLLAAEIGAFFGRLIVPVDYLPGGEARIAAEPAGHLYAAFLHDVDARRRGSSERHAARGFESDPDDPLLPWVRHEMTRIRAGHPDWWAAGETLLDDLGLGPGRTAAKT
jgi:hypothetical protein